MHQRAHHISRLAVSEVIRDRHHPAAGREGSGLRAGLGNERVAAGRQDVGRFDDFDIQFGGLADWNALWQFGCVTHGNVVSRFTDRRNLVGFRRRNGLKGIAGRDAFYRRSIAGRDQLCRFAGWHAALLGPDLANALCRTVPWQFGRFANWHLLKLGDIANRNLPHRQQQRIQAVLGEPTHMAWHILPAGGVQQVQCFALLPRVKAADFVDGACVGLARLGCLREWRRHRLHRGAD